MNIENYEDYVKIANAVKYHDYLYFVKNEPEITDEAYDLLYFMLVDYEVKHPNEILHDSPTQVSHTEPSKGRKQIKRRTLMLSTEKANDVIKVQKWMKSTARMVEIKPYNFVIEWKYDGVSCSLVYIDGVLVEASEGKGIDGNDVYKHCVMIPSIPKRIKHEGRLEVRGEILCPFKNLEKTGYKNCRSAAAGIMANIVPTKSNVERLEFYAWNVIGLESISHYDNLNYLESLGFNVKSRYNCNDIEDVKHFISKFESERSNLDIPVDGVVIKTNNTRTWSLLGRTDHHFKYLIAYKFAAETALTRIVRIEYSKGEKTGKITPIAYYEPVEIHGVTCERASLGSIEIMKKSGVKVGDTIVVSLRNDVIPFIEKIVK